jgi:hypothetical protein
MRNYRYSILFKGLVLVVAFVLPLLLLAGVAQAQSGPTIRTARWIFELSFDNGQIEARRINQLYLNNNLTHQWSQPITCQQTGAVTIGGNSATFNGGHLVCNLPSFQQEVGTYTQGLVQLQNSCWISGRRFDIWAQAEIGGVDFNKGNRHPILSHPDYQTTYAVEKANVNDAIMALDAGTNSESSSPFTPSGMGDLIGSRINQCNGKTCAARHMLNNVITDNNVIPQATAINGTTGATTIYVGRQGTERYYGNLISVRADPGCVATTN